MRLRVRMTGQNTSHFDKDWARISEIEEYRLDWSGQVCDRAHCGGERGQPRRFVNIRLASAHARSRTGNLRVTCIGDYPGGAAR